MKYVKPCLFFTFIVFCDSRLMKGESVICTTISVASESDAKLFLFSLFLHKNLKCCSCTQFDCKMLSRGYECRRRINHHINTSFVHATPAAAYQTIVGVVVLVLWLVMVQRWLIHMILCSIRRG